MGYSGLGPGHMCVALTEITWAEREWSFSVGNWWVAIKRVVNRGRKAKIKRGSEAM